MASHLKVLDVLNAEQLEELEAFAREPGRTVDEVAQWLLERGFNVSRNAAWRWKRSFDERVMAERFSRSGELARAIKDAVAAGSFGDVADAAVMQLVQVIFEQSSKMDAEGQIKSGDLLNMSIALRQMIGGKQQIEKLKVEFEQQKKAAVEEASNQAKNGASGEAVVATIKKALGIAA